MNNEEEENESINRNDKKTITSFIGRQFKKEFVKQRTTYEEKLKEMQKTIDDLKFKLAAKEK